MQFRSKKDGTHFPVGINNPSLDTFVNLKAQDAARTAGVSKPNIIFIDDPHRYGEKMSVLVFDKKDAQEIANRLKRKGWSGEGDKIEGIWTNEAEGQERLQNLLTDLVHDNMEKVRAIADNFPAQEKKADAK